MKTNVTAIAKNENRFVIEWIAHYLVLGIDCITIYDNESTDGMSETLDKLSQSFPVRRIHWPNALGKSPQVTAYNDALQNGADWICFFDLDEFLVLRDHDCQFSSFLSNFSDNVSAIGVNWVTFGSNGRTSKNYGLVRDAFGAGPPLDFKNNRHFKTIARPGRVKSMGVHAAQLNSGYYVGPSGEKLNMSGKQGVTMVADHSVAVLNHYQIKSREDFEEKIARGRAGRKSDDVNRHRNNGEAIWRSIDRNEFFYKGIHENRNVFLLVYGDLLRSLYS